MLLLRGLDLIAKSQGLLPASATGGNSITFMSQAFSSLTSFSKFGATPSLKLKTSQSRDSTKFTFSFRTLSSKVRSSSYHYTSNLVLRFPSARCTKLSRLFACVRLRRKRSALSRSASPLSLLSWSSSSCVSGCFADSVETGVKPTVLFYADSWSEFRLRCSSWSGQESRSRSFSPSWSSSLSEISAAFRMMPQPWTGQKSSCSVDSKLSSYIPAVSSS